MRASQTPDLFHFPHGLSAALGALGSMTWIIVFAGVTNREHALDACNWPFFITASFLSSMMATAISVVAQLRPELPVDPRDKFLRSSVIGTAAGAFCVFSITTPVLLLARPEPSFNQKALSIAAPAFAFFVGCLVSALAPVHYSPRRRSNVVNRDSTTEHPHYD